MYSNEWYRLSRVSHCHLKLNKLFELNYIGGTF